MQILFNHYLRFPHQVANVKLNNSRSVFKGKNYSNDSFHYSSIERYFNANFIRNELASNTELRQLLAKNNIPIKLNIDELQNLKNNHLLTTQNTCGRIIQNLPKSLKESVNEKDLKQAALLHDIGKVLIPAKILNKNGALTADEYNIMKLHSEIGYQLLKNTGLNDNVLNLIRNHHNNIDNGKKIIYDIDLQILNLADKYSALTEKRVYKASLSPNQALSILYNEVKSGKVHPFVFNSLVKTVHSNPFAGVDNVITLTNVA